MSRSEKKTPIIKYGGYGKLGKHFANKKVRTIDIGDYSNYKKVYESWNIFDIKYNFYKTHARKQYENRPMTIEEIMEYWRK